MQRLLPQADGIKFPMKMLSQPYEVTRYSRALNQNLREYYYVVCLHFLRLNFCTPSFTPCLKQPAFFPGLCAALLYFYPCMLIVHRAICIPVFQRQSHLSFMGLLYSNLFSESTLASDGRTRAQWPCFLVMDFVICAFWS